MPYIAVAMSRVKKIVILSDDSVLPFATMLDMRGDETDDADECMFAIVQLPNGTWTGVDLSEFDPVSVH